MPKRPLTDEYRAGIVLATAFLQSWTNRDDVAPWDMSDQFLSMRAQMSQQKQRGFQDTVFHYLQMTLDGTPPILCRGEWLYELEYPEAYKHA